jgi:hypothetical protein
MMPRRKTHIYIYIYVDPATLGNGVQGGGRIGSDVMKYLKLQGDNVNNSQPQADKIFLD